jgi:hypothetical protein
VIDFGLESNSKAGLRKALNWMGNQIGYDLLDENDSPRPGVHIVVFVPPGKTTAGIPDGYHFVGPFPHRRGVYDVDGNEVEAPVLSPNWVLNVRLTSPAVEFDQDLGQPISFDKSKIRKAIKDTGAELVRPTENSDHPGNVTYWQRDLDAGSPSDWVRLYWNISQWKNIWYGGMNE